MPGHPLPGPAVACEQPAGSPRRKLARPKERRSRFAYFARQGQEGSKNFKSGALDLVGATWFGAV